ncbi:ATP-binding domain-containing protein [Kineosporia sp. A_224]|uniref:HelD family protein n=1 Tax=Kineosporia sp. A_224 TaxID=1962180 RepID=UPI001E31E7DC|nr:ATP-binding domain-containing protein [Kineosporia sp. A_224]
MRSHRPGRSGSDAPGEDALSTADLHRDLDREATREQAYVDRLYDHLDGLRERTARSLEQVRRAPVVPTPGGRAERDAFDALHTERLRQLGAVEERLAFGRLDLRTGESRYVGRIGLSDDDRAQLLLDWRAPAASAFYQATAAQPQDVVRRRHIALRGRTVSGLDDEVLDAEGLEEAVAAGADLATITGEGALMSALTAHRTGRMKDIVATLQSEQDRVVRAPLAGVLVVQGGPGTGKTAVALHRAAYLLYTHRDRIARSGVLVVGPSPVFLRYIEQVLPSLGETGVVLSTPGQLFPGVDATGRDRADVAVVKGDLRMAEVVKAAVRRRQRRLVRPVPLDVDGDVVELRPRVVADARGRARQSGKPHNEARVTFVRHLLDDLAGQLATARGVGGEAEERGALLEELRTHADVRREVNLLWLPLSATGVVTELLTRPDRLALAADGILSEREQALLLRGPLAPWTPGDVPLLDEAAELLGADVAVTDAARRAAAMAATERAEALEFAKQVLGTAGEAAEMLTPEMLADRFAGGPGVGPLADRARDDRTWAFGHAVVDEAQELSPMQWRLLARRVPSRSMTVVGDVAQTGSAAGTTSWAEVLDDHIGADRWVLEQLTVNYRTPARVMAVATALLEAYGIKVAPPNAAREGDHDPLAVLLPSREADAVVASASHAVRADDAVLDGGRFAVVVPREGYEAFPAALRALLAGPLADRVEVVTVDEAKGLEYDGVTVVDPAAVVAQSARGVNDLYVALTRPTQRLTVLHHGDLPPGLDGLVPAAGTAAAGSNGSNGSNGSTNGSRSASRTGAPAPRAAEPEPPEQHRDTLF